MAGRLRLGLFALKATDELAQEPAESAFLLLRLFVLLGTLVGWELDSRLLLDDARDGAARPSKDRTSSLTGKSVLKGLRLAELLAHLQLAIAAVAVAGVVDALLMVLAPLDTLPRQLATEIVLQAPVKAMPPVFDRLEHELPGVPDSIIALVTLGRVVQHAVDDAVQGPLYVGTVIIDSLHELGNDPLQHLGSGATGDLIQNLRVPLLDDAILTGYDSWLMARPEHLRSKSDP
jgi:hypothetical protein